MYILNLVKKKCLPVNFLEKPKMIAKILFNYFYTLKCRLSKWCISSLFFADRHLDYPQAMKVHINKEEKISQNFFTDEINLNNL